MSSGGQAQFPYVAGPAQKQVDRGAAVIEQAVLGSSRQEYDVPGLHVKVGPALQRLQIGRTGFGVVAEIEGAGENVATRIRVQAHGGETDPWRAGEYLHEDRVVHSGYRVHRGLPRADLEV